MDYEDTKSSDDAITWSTITLLYSGGAVVSLLSSFIPSLSQKQSASCLAISWLLALAALAISLVTDRSSDEVENDL